VQGLFAAGAEHQIGAGVGELARDLSADPLARAGDDGDLAGQLATHPPAFRVSSRAGRREGRIIETLLRSPALEDRSPPFREGLHPLRQILALRNEGLRERFFFERRLQAALVGAVDQALRQPEGERRGLGEAFPPFACRSLELVLRDDLVAETDGERLVGADRVAEEDQLLAL
jgi:hypothetical protein